MNKDTDFYFQWHITNVCNNRCRHCYHENYSRASEMTGKQLIYIADQIEDALEKWNLYGSIAVTGGEPFTRKDDLFQLLAHIEARCERVAQYDILTNGTLMTDNIMDALLKNSKLRRIQVSLEGSSPESHDLIRGQGDFQRVVSTIERLKQRGFTVSVMTTLTRNNMNLIPEIIALLGSLSVDYFALERFMPEGRGKDNSNWVLSREEIKAVFEYMTEQAFAIKIPHILLYRTLYCLCGDNETVGAMCSAGASALTILPDAAILPCRRLPIIIGNVMENGIIDTWYNSELLWELRNFSAYKGKCGGCEHFLGCRGCRSMAYLATGDYMQEDPQCWK